MNLTSLIAPGMKYVSSLAATGPWGIAAMVVGGLGFLGAIAVLIAKANRAADEASLDQGGADAGVTAQSLKVQAESNREFIEKARSDFNKA